MAGKLGAEPCQRNRPGMRFDALGIGSRFGKIEGASLKKQKNEEREEMQR